MYSRQVFGMSSPGDHTMPTYTALGLVPVGMFCFRSIQARR